MCVTGDWEEEGHQSPRIALGGGVRNPNSFFSPMRGISMSCASELAQMREIKAAADQSLETGIRDPGAIVQCNIRMDGMPLVHGFARIWRE
jgi:hypothetical protein